MTATETSPLLAGCELSTLDSAVCQRWLAWLLGDSNVAPEGAPGLHWALAHCDDGVTWGRYDADAKVWRLGNQVAPEVSPPIHRESLLELRLFGETSEVLIWRTDAGLVGRVIREGDPAPGPGDISNPLRPSDDSRILRGGHVVAQRDHDFTRVGDQTGAEQVLPLAVTAEQLRTGQVRLAARHYYEADAETGAVRITATRLVTLTSGGTHGA
ncbi:MAG: hypothetical protein HYV63_13015 [Candidatus Schekmanbacteria bacterium]|nr:hypothetical protein [Candidatus Schekmanbacteria bacterium]